MSTITANSTTEIILNSPAYVNPVILDPDVTVSSTTALGVYAAAGSWTIQNFGSIAGANSNLFQSAGIWLQSGGSVTNETSASVTDQIAGIVMYNGAGTVVNDGSIAATNASNLVSWGIRLDSGGSVTNAVSASISAASGSGGSVGVEASRGGGTVVNDGSIGADGPSGQGIALSLGGYVTNASGARISGSEQGIIISGGVGTVVNGGQIVAGPGTGGIGIRLVTGGSVTNATSASITSTGQGISIGGGAGTVVNNGYIGSASQAVMFPTGYLNLLVVSPGAKFEGIVDGGNPIGANSVSTLELGSGTSVGTLAGLGTQFTKFSSITFDSGSTWFVDGSPAGLAGIISGFSSQDTIKIDGITVTGTTFANGILSLSGSSGVVTLNLPGNFNTNSFAVTNGTGGAYVSVLPRTLSWIGGNASTAFETAANWDDVTDGQDPALSAPTATDRVEFNTVEGGVTGSGTVAAINVAIAGDGVLDFGGGSTLVTGSLDAGVSASGAGQIGLFDAGTELRVTGAATIADAGTGVLSVLNGATFSAASLTIGAQSSADSSGAAVVSGSGSMLNIAGALNVGTSLGTGDLTIGPGAAVSASVVNLDGQVVIEGGLLDPTVNIINQGQTAGGFGTVAAGFIVDEGVLQAGGTKASEKLLLLQGTVLGGGTLLVDGTIQAAGTPGMLQINAGGTMKLTGAVLNAAATSFQDDLATPNSYAVKNSMIDVTFADATGVLLLDDIAGFGGTITSYSAGDSFVVAGGTLSNLGVANGNTLTASDSGPNAGVGGTDSIIFGSAIGSTDFQIVNNNTILAQAIACFAEGTRIETEIGPVCVEELRVGNRVVIADGRLESIVRIRYREVNCTGLPVPELVWPVRIARGAFDENVPVRDLYLSPDHAVFVSGSLVPVKLLVNGTSIVQIARPKIVYFHVELAGHEVILAERLRVESFLDVGDRADRPEDSERIRILPDFDSRLAPDIAAIWEAWACAPLVLTGPILAAIRRSSLAGGTRALPGVRSHGLKHRQPVIDSVAV